MGLRELLIEKELIRLCKANGILQRKIMYLGRSGATDRMLIKNGKVYFVELKRENKTKLDALQEVERRELIKHGANHRLVNNLVSLDNLMFEVCNESF